MVEKLVTYCTKITLRENIATDIKKIIMNLPLLCERLSSI